jgi:hypothetical protein
MQAARLKLLIRLCCAQSLVVHERLKQLPGAERLRLALAILATDQQGRKL